jgi:transposase
MTIDPEQEAKILRLHLAEHWKVGTIAQQLGVHHTTVERVLSTAGVPVVKQPRATLADPYVPFIVEQLEKYPELPASSLYEMVSDRGYPGKGDHFRKVVARFRPRKPTEAYLRLRTLPGEQGQVDWAHFGKLTVGRAVRPLMAFVMVLSWSRHLFVRFFMGMGMAQFLKGHQEAFAYFGGVPRHNLYDNLKSVVLERKGDAIRFNPAFLDFASHYRFEPRPVAVGRGNEKARVERAIRYLRGSFFMARSWHDLDDLNAQVRAWCQERAGERRCQEDETMTVREAFEQEQPQLLALADDDYPAAERKEVRVGKTPYVRFDLNDYSVPHDHVRRTLLVVADEHRVRVLDGPTLVAEHERSYDKGALVENPAHVEALVERKKEARRHRGMDRLQQAAPNSRDLLLRCAERGHNLGSVTAGLLRLLDRFGASEMEQSIAEAISQDAPHLAAVRQILDRRLKARNQPPPVDVPLPDDPRIRDIVVTPHALETYDQLEPGDEDDDNETP